MPYFVATGAKCETLYNNNMFLQRILIGDNKHVKVANITIFGAAISVIVS